MRERNGRNVVISLSPEQTLKEAMQILSENGMTEAPVVDGKHKVVGLLTSVAVMKAISNGVGITEKVGTIMEKCATVNERDINEGMAQNPFAVPVVDDSGKLVGFLSKEEQISRLMSKIVRMEREMQEAQSMLDTMKTVLDSAYEGVVVVDSTGRVRDINRSYCQLLGIKREDAIDRHVTEVIENTRLHFCIQSGIPERGFIQRIHGRDMVVHRIPIWNDGRVIGAIGMVIFQEIDEVYKIIKRLQDLSRKASQKGTDMHVDQQQPKQKNDRFEEIVGRSPEMSQIKLMIRKAARVPSTVLITGESGTGKELLARAIHQASSYAGGKFVGVNCAAIPEPLLEAELFGYEEGAFTGAKKGGKLGKFQLAHKGTLFLDEIGDMPLHMQAKILRVLEEKKIERVGGLSEIEIDVRIIAATNKNLEEMVRKGQFREDLFFRLNIIRIEIPPLRQRKMDIPDLLAHHMERICGQFGVEPKEFTRDAMQVLIHYPWPGNIRELVNTVEWLAGMVEGRTITKEHLPKHILHGSHPYGNGQESGKQPVQEGDVFQDTDWRDYVYRTEKEKIMRALIEEKGNKAAAARKLGIHRSTLYEKLKKYHL